MGGIDRPAAEAGRRWTGVSALLADLESDDRARRLAAAFALGEALAGRGKDAASDPDVARAIVGLKALAADRTLGTSWVRKRAKRALRKIRGEADADGAREEGRAPPP